MWYVSCFEVVFMECFCSLWEFIYVFLVGSCYKLELKCYIYYLVEVLYYILLNYLVCRFLRIVIMNLIV